MRNGTFKGLVLFIVLFGVGACQSHQTYGELANTETLGNLYNLKVNPMYGATEQMVSDKLEPLIHPNGRALTPIYVVDIKVHENIDTSNRNQNGDSIRQDYQISAAYTLINNETDEILTEGSVFHRVSYEAGSSIYQNNFNNKSFAQEEVFSSVAQKIAVRLLEYFDSTSNNPCSPQNRIDI